ncbi:MAG TPA: HAMP domain-containing sensor histidine kinase [Candidatus Krumholzibacteria bacterium]|nr:HAMP domain-containing sensor histidine kinase [Candidatus Krumholzibacteria bacterium]
MKSEESRSAESSRPTLEAAELLQRIPRLLRFRLAGRADRLLLRLAEKVGFAGGASLYIELESVPNSPLIVAERGIAPERWTRQLQAERIGLLSVARIPVARRLSANFEPVAARLLQGLNAQRLTVIPLGCQGRAWRLLLLAEGPRFNLETLAGMRDLARTVLDAARRQEESGPARVERSTNSRPGSRSRTRVVRGADVFRLGEGQLSRARRLVDHHNDAVGNLSHDLKNPLAAISTSLQVLASGRAGVLEPHQLRLLGLARRNTERLERMVESFAKEAQRQEGETVLDWRELDASELVNQAMASSAAMALTQDRQLAWVVDHGSTVYGDPDRILRILDNLVGNALKFSGHEGSVLVSARKDMVRKEDELARAAASLGHALRGLSIAVEDDGPGMSEEVCARAFERFWQEDEERGRGRGSGLGLSIVQSLVLALHGTVGLTSEPQKGTCARVWLPGDEACGRLCAQLQSLVRELDRLRVRCQSARLLLLELSQSTDELMAGFENLHQQLVEEGRNRWTAYRVHSSALVLLLDEDEPYPTSLSVMTAESKPGMSAVLRQGTACFPRDGESLDVLLEQARNTMSGQWLVAAVGAGQREKAR